VPRATRQYPSTAVTPLPSWCNLVSYLVERLTKRKTAPGRLWGSGWSSRGQEGPYPWRALAQGYKPVTIRCCHIVFFLVLLVLILSRTANIAQNGPIPTLGLRMVKPRPRGPLMNLPVESTNHKCPFSFYQNGPYPWIAHHPSAAVTRFPSWCNLPHTWSNS